MSDAPKSIQVIEGAVFVTAENGKGLAIFTGRDLLAWRRFQLDAMKSFNVEVPDAFMPGDISNRVYQRTR